MDTSERATSPTRDPAAAHTALLADVMRELRARAEADPFANPVLLFALDLTLRVDRGDLSPDDVEAVVQHLTMQGFADRAARLATYLGETDIQANRRALDALLASIAAAAESLDRFRAIVERAAFGIVVTAHPTFAMRLSAARALSELASDMTCDGVPLDDVARAERLALARDWRHRAPEEITLDIEHDWSVEALEQAHGALEDVHRAALRAARERWPQEWTRLTPRMVMLASWVGYDQDGRTDVTWYRVYAKRLAVKRLFLQRHQKALARIIGEIIGADDTEASSQVRAALARATAMLDAAFAMVCAQERLLAAAERDPREAAAFARAMVSGRNDAMVEVAPLVSLLNQALAAADNDTMREELLVLCSSLQTHGLGLAHTHVRLNASQLHNAIRRQVGLDTEPNDPANRRSYFNAINDLLGRVRPLRISFAPLLEEGASAKRLMITVAQILKFIDGTTPVRFLIAETETGFTLLTALYYARLFGVEDQVEISPLFETEEALERGERVFEEALKSPHFRDYLRRQGRIAVQFGFSDSGRFIGQMAATFRIERLRLRLAQMLERYDLTGLDVILFNTHGESIGRGGHPYTFADRLRYVAPPISRAEFESRGMRVKEEVSFQGGDGYLPFLTPAAALASLRQIVEFMLAPDGEANGDPIYAAPDYASEFFATVQQEFASLVGDPDYTALLGTFGTHMLYRTGSRPTAREHDEWSEPVEFNRPSRLRAIPNNAILQQLGFLANTLYGVGRAAAKDPEMFAAMRERSPRFRRALEMVAAAVDATDLDVLRAYAATFDPAMWLTRSGRTRNSTRAKELRELARLTERIGLHDRVSRVIRRLQGDHLQLLELIAPSESARRDRLLLLHGIRIAIIHRICLLATAIPSFSPQQGVSHEEIIERIIRLDVERAVAQLTLIFPASETLAPTMGGDFGEPSGYRPESALSYALERDRLFDPLLRLYDLVRRIGSAITYEVGALG
jgi:phosphoenolpyruvate carboxylase